MSEPTHVFQMFINAEPSRVWQAIIDGEQTVKYYYGTRVDSTWVPGAPIRYLGGDGSLVASGEVLAIDAPGRLEMTLVAHWDDALEAEGPSREVWLLEDANGATKLTLEMHDVEVGSKTYEDFMGGFPVHPLGLKTFVETGDSLPALY